MLGEEAQLRSRRAAAMAEGFEKLLHSNGRKERSARDDHERSERSARHHRRDERSARHHKRDEETLNHVETGEAVVYG